MSKRYTYDDVKKFIEDNTDFELLEKEYIDCKTKMKLKCKCGNEHELNFDVIKNLKQTCCAECGIKNKIERKRQNSFPKVKKFVEENSNAMLLEEKYKNNSTKMKFRCKCGKDFVTTFAHFKDQNKRECNECSEKKKTGKFKPYTFSKVKEIIESKGCELLSKEYNSNTQKLDIKCVCGETFTTDLAGFSSKNKTRCDKCTKKQSTYARIVEEYLRLKNIKFVKEYRFKKCRYILPLPFDFYLPGIKTCIEVDGEMHYTPSRFKDAKKDFRETLLRDSIKSQFCKENKIQLIRIPYYEIKNEVYQNRINMLIPR
jgi:very-short-patch-repair endonuclease